MILPIRDSELNESVLPRLLNDTLTGVSYRVLLPADGDGAYAGREFNLDCDIAAVVVEFESVGQIAITWATLGEEEGLSVLVDPDSADVFSSDAIDATGSKPWSACLGTPVLSLSGSWQDSGARHRDTLWSLRLNFAEQSVVTALGGFDGRLTYQADELVVISDEATARTFYPAHARTHAWGDTLF